CSACRASATPWRSACRTRSGGAAWWLSSPERPTCPPYAMPWRRRCHGRGRRGAWCSWTLCHCSTRARSTGSRCRGWRRHR
ncbi:MAG: O-succinylbenzoic acid--CoA ligase, partial [uncultured Nocardioidaceae bacterium]